MLEIVAIGPDPGQTWCREISPGQTVRIGRAPENGWDVPWDQRVSREHADISWEGEYLTVRCLDAARNPAHFDDQTVREFTIGPGEKFRIGVTTFRVELPANVRAEQARKSPDEGTIDDSGDLYAKLQSQIQSNAGPAQVNPAAALKAPHLFAGKAKSEGDYDPYHRWLGIPPNQQPADFYRLLGLTHFESDPDVIEAAADRQMAHVRSYQTGRRSDASQTVLNELSSAKLCLLTADKKSKYDQELRKVISVQQAPGSVFSTDTNSNPADNLEGEVCGGYILLDHISSGHMGEVFKAKHQTMDRTVALKILSGEGQDSAAAAERFRRKVTILSRLSHTNLVAAYDAGQRDGSHYLVMEFVDGSDLMAQLKARETLSIDDVINYVTQAAEGLGYAHANGIVHRNVKPSKLLVDKQGVVKVIGWGRALFTGDTSLGETNPNQIVGTVDYMAPEQGLKNQVVDHRADIYSLGCTFFRLVTRRLVFSHKTSQERLAAHRRMAPPSLRQFRPDASPALDGVFQKMVAKSPENRFQSMSQVVAALQASQHFVSTAPIMPVFEPIDETPSILPPAQPSAPADSESINLSNFLGSLSEEEQQHWKRLRK